MKSSRFYTLLQYFKEDVISEKEWHELQTMIKTGCFDQLLEDDLLISLAGKGKQEKWTADIEQEILAGIHAQISEHSNRSGYKLWIAVAAVFLLMSTAGIIFFKSKDPLPAKINTLSHKYDIPPGGNRALLTLPGGEPIVLNDSSIRQLKNQTGGSIVKAGNGILVYKANALAGQAGKEMFNTISTPRGGQYQVILPDGTHVWLNAASSLRFPAAFKGEKRLVKLNGEAYFEVAKNKRMPFIVQTENQEVEVLGTHFNISSYADETATKTTLLEGSVKVTAQAGQKVLSPGEQALTNKDTRVIKVMPVSIEDAIAWKNGYFVFNDEKLESIMHRVSRWYDVEYHFEGKQGDLSFLGVVERSKNISSLLKVLASTGNVHFKIEGRKIIVMP
ncbi:FecR protein [Pedobacter steynii]|uniref:FecR protein n=1 Tax=Pedobacter steynii TaxID=430522 RepID=A0A1G9JLF6_9SPHI|nr:FecR family protein [Pedobacter steynii]NQX38278.1 FecR domain-containing protein [Pedobacter steynii]SDL37893.1 FecR protein [Pedobacter steynii]